MQTLKSILPAVLLVLTLYCLAAAQVSTNPPPQQATLTITANASGDRVRVTAPSSVVQMHLEIYAATGQKLFDQEIRGGNVFDWHLQDGQAQRLPAGEYVCVVTAKTISGRLTQKIGAVTVAENSAGLRDGDSQQFTPPQAQAIGPVEADSSWTVVADGDNQTTTVIAHNGTEGQMIRGRGALTFRIGDFFRGKDEEQMRLTEEGNLGIGTSTPQSKLEVAGTIRAERFLVVKPSTPGTKAQTTGATQTADSAGSVQPLASGSGTQNQIAKWTDNAGALGDSLISESGGNVVVGNAGQAGNIQIFGPATQDVFAGMGPDLIAGPAFNYGYAGASFGRSAGFFNVRPDASADPPNPSLRFATANVQRMIVTNTGNVGIGTLNPSTKLDVAGDINAATQYNIGGSRVLSTDFGTGSLFAGFGAGLNTTGSGFSNSFFGSGAGFVNTFGRDNSFFGNSAGVANTFGKGNSFFGSHVGDTNIDGQFNTAIGIGADVGSSNLTNATAIGAHARVDASDSLVLGSIKGVNGASADTRVGIGINAPLATLHVVSFSSGVFDNTADFQAPNIGPNHSHIHYSVNGDWYIRSAASAGQVILQDTGGNVGIGTASPDQRLTVNGEADKPGGGSWATFSDERLKTIKGRFTPGLKAVMKLQPLRYEYKPDNALGLKSSGQHIGFGAQAVQKIIPEAVSKNDKGYLLVNNDPIMWTMLNAIKEQQKEIEDQHQQLQQKRAQMEKLETRLAALEMMLRKSSKQRPRR